MTTDDVRHKSLQALLLVDVVNHFEFPDGKRILRNALKIAPRLRLLKGRARRSNTPVIYVNDNFGQWRSDAVKLLAYCLRTQSAGRPFVEGIRPDAEDYCVAEAHAFGLLSESFGCAPPSSGRLLAHYRRACHG